jgi:hypothetical protein
MKTITKELVLLDVEDIEEAVTNFLEKDETVKISQMDCTLLYNTPTDTGIDILKSIKKQRTEH